MFTAVAGPASRALTGPCGQVPWGTGATRFAPARAAPRFCGQACGLDGVEQRTEQRGIRGGARRAALAGRNRLRRLLAVIARVRPAVAATAAELMQSVAAGVGL